MDYSNLPIERCKNGNPVKTIPNYLKLLQNDPNLKDKFRLDKNIRKSNLWTHLEIRTPEGWEVITELDRARLNGYLEETYSLNLRDRGFTDALIIISTNKISI